MEIFVQSHNVISNWSTLSPEEECMDSNSVLCILVDLHPRLVLGDYTEIRRTLSLDVENFTGGEIVLKREASMLDKLTDK